MIISQQGLGETLAQASTEQHWRLDVFDQLPSTNDYLREVEQTTKAAKSIQLCATDWQTAGHGRRGKHWSSQRGNVTFSMRQVVQLPVEMLLGLSLVAGLAVVVVLRERLGVKASLKWPNDVLVDGRKLGGLLIELLAPSEHLRRISATEVITGIGINVRHQPEFDGMGIGATSLQSLDLPVTLDRNELISAIAVSVASHYEIFVKHGWSAFEQRWASIDALFGKNITVSGGSQLTGRAAGVDSHGALLIDTGSEINAVMAGEVSVRTV